MHLFDLIELIDKLNEPGKLENCSGTRTLMHNIADLKAQIAANLKVIDLRENSSRWIRRCCLRALN